MREFKAIVLKIIDGDTAKFSVRLRRTRWVPRSLGFHVYFEDRWVVVHETMRFLGINAAEHGTVSGDSATAYLKSILPVGEQVTIKTERADQQDRYGRFLAAVTYKGTDINQAMIDSGHAAPWDGHGPRPVPTGWSRRSRVS